MNAVIAHAFREELAEIVKTGGIFDRIIQGVGDLTRGGNLVGGVSGSGPSEGFKKWQAAQEALKKAPKPTIRPPVPTGARP